MKFALAFLVILISLTFTKGEQKWYNYKTTWRFKESDPQFFDQPRNVSEAIKAGWKEISNDCSSTAKFPGHRYASPEAGGPGMVFIYDVNGFIAGTHSVVPKSKTYDDQYPWTQSDWYRQSKINGKDVFLTTVYFIDPEKICNGGRTQAEFDVDGTGKKLLFQNGDRPSDHIVAPLTQQEADEDPAWFKHNCYDRMGIHYFLAPFNYTRTVSCDTLAPIQLLYSGGVLNAFVWQHPTDLEDQGKYWEPLKKIGIPMIIRDAPKCLEDLAKPTGKGVTIQHNYMRNTNHTCRKSDGLALTPFLSMLLFSLFFTKIAL